MTENPGAAEASQQQKTNPPAKAAIPHKKMKIRGMEVDVRTIRTKLIKKEELFLTMALGEVTGLPILLIGPPGVAKTAALIEYAAAMMDYDKERAKEKAFIIELDESTKAGDIKGRVNMKEYLQNQNYTLEAPIADAEYILINEVDKGSSAIRNSMLSIMREKVLFLGKDKRRCPWKIFAASCNVIPSDELENPFWDRFIIKLHVDRISAGDVMEVWEDNKYEFDVPLPTLAQVKAVTLNLGRMKTFCDTIHKSVSDRTLTFLPLLVKAVKLIWNLGEVEAMVKVCQYIAPDKANGLPALVEDTRIVQIKSELQLLRKIQNTEEARTRLEKIIMQAGTFGTTVSSEDLEGIASGIRNVAYQKKFRAIKDGIDSKLAALLAGEEIPTGQTGTDAFAGVTSQGAGTERVEVEIENA